MAVRHPGVQPDRTDANGPGHYGRSRRTAQLLAALYVPLSFMSRRDGIPWDKSPKESEYIEFLWDALEMNSTHAKYSFAFLAYHMLTMSFVCAHGIG